MKSPSFNYVRPSSLAEVFDLLKQHGDDARILAGGQTLLATLNMRLSEPGILIDINHLAPLSGIRVDGDRVVIGALARHREIERSDVIARHLPLLAEAAPHIAHPAIRNRGTFGGSIAFADPAAEWPSCAVAMDAEIVLTNGEYERKVGASDFFIDLYETDLRQGEIISACEFAISTPARRTAFFKLTRRHGDYAIVGVAASAQYSDEVLQDLRIVFFSIGSTPMRALGAETVLNGHTPTEHLLKQARESLSEDIHASGDLYTAPDVKMHLAGVLLGRAVTGLMKGPIHG
jgi:carbon-monoxide dehydrogenase medium subunit